MSIKSKLVFSLAALSLVIAALVFENFYSAMSLNKNLKTVIEDRLIPLQHIKKVADTYAVDVVDSSHKVRSGLYSWDDGIRSVQSATATSAEEWQAYVSTYLTPDEKLLVEKANAAMIIAEAATAEVLGIFKAEDRSALETFIDNRLYPAIDPLSSALTDLVDLQGEIALSIYTDSQAAFSKLLMMLTAMGGVALAAVLYAGFVIFRTVSGRLTKRKARCLLLRRGNWRRKFPRQVIATKSAASLTQPRFSARMASRLRV